MDDILDFEMGGNDKSFASAKGKWSASKRTYRVSLIAFPALLGDCSSVKEQAVALHNEMNTRDDGSDPGVKWQGCRMAYSSHIKAKIMVKNADYERFATDDIKTYAATVALVWVTDNEGQINKFTIQQPPEVVPWVVNSNTEGRDGKYQTLAKKNKNRPFHSHDIQVDCTDEKFQSMDFDMLDGHLFKVLIERALGTVECKEKLKNYRIRKDKDGNEIIREPDSESLEILEGILESAAHMQRKVRSYIGAKDMTIEAIKAKMNSGETGGSSSSGGSTSVPQVDQDALSEALDLDL